MATDYSETILDNVVTALQSITTANGYNYNLQGAERWDRFAHPAYPAPFADVDRLGQIRRTDGSLCLEQLQVGIRLIINQDPDSAERTSVIEGKWIHDVRKALFNKFSLTGDEVRILEVMESPFHVESEDEDDDGVLFSIRFDYQTAYEDPATLVDPQ